MDNARKCQAIRKVEKEFYPSDSRNISGFIKEIVELIYHSIQRQKILHFELILEEVVLNAWKHGNQKKINKSITVRLSFDSALLVLEVIDQGTGFNFNSVPDPTQANNIKKPSGKGLFIVCTYAKEVQWIGSCNHIKIQIKLLAST